MYYFKMMLYMFSYVCRQMRIYQNLLEFVEAVSKGQGHIRDDSFFWSQNIHFVVTELECSIMCFIIIHFG